MARFRIEYHVTLYTPADARGITQAYASVIRLRRDAARIAVERMAFQAAENCGRLATDKAYDNRAKARNWTGDRTLQLEIGGWLVLAERIECH